ncbi:hypothetical protein [Microbulbifer aestuariivivens]|uniref:hypothetical protein n=1 Tax=Microbulbifer aestuariivivens TaxID=1908308 RepID=UPI0031ED7635
MKKATRRYRENGHRRKQDLQSALSHGRMRALSSFSAAVSTVAAGVQKLGNLRIFKDFSLKKALKKS